LTGKLAKGNNDIGTNDIGIGTIGGPQFVYRLCEGGHNLLLPTTKKSAHSSSFTFFSAFWHFFHGAQIPMGFYNHLARGGGGAQLSPIHSLENIKQLVNYKIFYTIPFRSRWPN
jgi:hypothetical protein